jgi:hypothetical protein
MLFLDLPNSLFKDEARINDDKASPSLKPSSARNTLGNVYVYELDHKPKFRLKSF